MSEVIIDIMYHSQAILFHLIIRFSYFVFFAISFAFFAVKGLFNSKGTMPQRSQRLYILKLIEFQFVQFS